VLFSHFTKRLQKWPFEVSLIYTEGRGPDPATRDNVAAGGFAREADPLAPFATAHIECPVWMATVLSIWHCTIALKS
jgi:hypothetical protein